MFAIILVFLVAAVQLKASDISCESIESRGPFGNCCYLDETTVISEQNVTISDQESFDVKVVMFENNKNIQFLPVSTYRNFPNLEMYFAKNASVKEISALNFERLTNLKYLDLSSNEIEFVPNFCFNGLSELSQISLGGNKITTMNGIAFANVPRLEQVGLEGNTCVNRTFVVEDPNSFRRRISRNCATTDVGRKEISCRKNWPCLELANEVFVIIFNRTTRCCVLGQGTFIDTPDFSFVADGNYTDIELISVAHQKNIEFLPVMVHKRFPNLTMYQVINTPVRKISKENFEKMDKLEFLQLRNNKIEVIRQNTFEDLISLRYVIIVKQQLTSLNPQAFASLNQLFYLDLTHNFCIDRSYSLHEVQLPETNITSSISRSCGFVEFDVVEVWCEKYQDQKNYDSCFLTRRTVINATNFVIADLRDENVEGIIFEGNKRIQYLPHKVFEQFPNLDIYAASECSIKQISRENFQNLNRLKGIDLDSNKIQKISGNTFQGLRSLRGVFLRNNQIKAISGRTFDQIPTLRSIDLVGNECIDDEVENVLSIKNFTRKVLQNCAFTETGEREFEKVFNIECGVGMPGTGFIIGGNETKRGQWPFLASLLKEPENKFFCGGSIITASHVLTAAHCVSEKLSEKPLVASEVIIFLGRHNISRVELGSEIRGVKEIKIHPGWNPSDIKYGGDIAVLGMNQAVQFSELIQPICLTVETELSQREAGYVIGWGNTETFTPKKTVPRQVLISSVSTDVCFAKDFVLGNIFAEGMFCAGGDGAGPCLGDSGGGFFVRYHGLWTLRGVVSSGKVTSEGECEVNRHTLFTNVLDYTEWIDDAVKTSFTSSYSSVSKIRKIDSY